ncbi:hypothetical protein [Bosea sp. BH3]|uniref:hypothetical protein n=1 Tax=Bosea sp. BH3 TaxID=2871701 RepID=UPI0021CB91B5|nr:hypothetical protein [Bosea sp. BH3]MCU4178717.1 hypothetical protein [Bosea sp. BH3]
MAHTHAHVRHAPHAAPSEPGWSLLRLSAGARVGLAAVVVAALWLATLAVIF